MTDPGICTEIADIADLNRKMLFLNMLYQSNREPIGVRIDISSSSPTVQRIDKNFNEINPDTTFFQNHELFQWPKCTLTESGVPTYSDYLNGTNLDGTTLDLSGANGDVMARIPNPKMRYEYDSSAGKIYILYAPPDSNHPYFDYHPNHYSRGKLNDYFFTAVYKAGLKDDNGTLKFASHTGAQPWTGGQIRALNFNTGTVVGGFTIGETLTGAGGATGTIIAYHTSSGTWGTDAAGVVYLKSPGVDAGTATAYVTNEQLTGSTSGACANASGAATTLGLTMDNAISYASAKGAGWGIADIHAWSIIQGLLYTQYGTRNLQSAVGNGLLNFSTSPTAGFNGLATGADLIDTRLDMWGNGTGNNPRSDGYTSISCNNLQDLWGNGWEMIHGINMYTDNTYRILKKDYSGAQVATLVDGSYDTGISTLPTSVGYIKEIQTDKVGATAFVPKSAGGTGSGNSAFFCDTYDNPTSTPSVLIVGGGSILGLQGGIGCWYAKSGPTYTSRLMTARLTYIPQ